jgi:hypothetical protein
VHVRIIWNNLRRRAAPPAPTPLSTLTSANGGDAGHREIAAMAVRDVLKRYGIPPTWITANPQTSAILRRGRGVHLQLMVREWHPQMLPFMPSIERSVRSRTLRLDPFSKEWLHGISWRFELVDDSKCPSMPHPDWWAVQDASRRSAASDSGINRARIAESVRVRTWTEERTMELAEQPTFMPTQPMPQEPTD